ncbi:hypothetical protein BDV95DRAFT_143204 [Massariosphaeria phaeospora]|uniref:Uncharacterized protein n=1 Tax=Massariosphaeria phaeospora TaxID=100035 RepID=A0A7C8MH12_9PLEO|nr:hypothetical protein BDV95DRAFT_143204 [Massariosphaeria phaeospora]
MSELDSRFVKRGMWTDWAKGAVMGKTITTDTRTGTFLVALLAVTSSIGIAHLWNLVVFGIHQARADGHESDGLFRQQQVLLRTLPTPTSTLTDFIKLWWSWRHRSNHSFTRSLPVFALAVFFVAATIATSLLSSFVISTTNLEVLVSSPFCGSVNGSDMSETRSYSSSFGLNADTYAQQCYQNGTLPTLCNIFTRPKVPFTAERVACPFANLCEGGDALHLDSGLLDVSDTFGINLPSEDRVQLRRTATCAVLSLDGRTEVRPASELDQSVRWRPLLPGEEVLYLDYGHQTDETNLNWTKVVHLSRSNVTWFLELVGGSLYCPGTSDPTFQEFYPISELRSDDADTILLFATTSRAMFTHPVNDRLFAAHTPYEWYDFAQRKNVTIYFGDFPIRGIGCFQRYQYCHAQRAGPDICSPLGPYFAKNSTAAPSFPAASNLQKAVLQMIQTISRLFEIGFTTLIQANEKRTPDGLYGQFPDDQWVHELTLWFSVMWSQTQFGMSMFAVGPSLLDAEAEVKSPLTAEEQQLCQMQKMKKTGGFVNINVFGLAFVLTLSAVIVMLNITLLKFLIFLSRSKHAFSPRITRWIQDGIWQLQRRAYEAQDQGNWVDLEMDIPLTEKGQLLPDLQPPALVFISAALRPASSNIAKPLVAVKEVPVDSVNPPGTAAISITQARASLEIPKGLSGPPSEHCQDNSSTNNT